MQLMLAPMEGVIDHTMRELLTSLGGIDRCVTEFVRVTERLLPSRVFQRLCPELANGGCTTFGVPVYIQLLGGQAGVLADNAARAAELGAAGIDLNFGCPAKNVNRSDGGSIILREPQRVHAIAAAVLGGFSLRGGEGSIIGVVLGAVLLQVLQNLVNLLGIPSSLNFAVMGSVILIGVLVDQQFGEYRRRRAAQQRQ